MLIEFASVEEITLNVHDHSDKVIVFYQDTDDENIPEITEADGTIHIKTAKAITRLKGTEKNKYRAGQPIFPSYMIHIPKDLDVQLFYEKGNFKTTNFNGKLDLHLDTGNAIINQFEGELAIESFAGLIRCNVLTARLHVISTKGKIVSDLQDKRLLRTKNSLKGIYVNANNVLKIKSIHGKVNLKSMLTQK